ncbi:MAG TPA: hypothetical protein VM409_08575, partial [Chloroflexia bacterium]|nr:hypothetical protein [Chloroflexia bacterium]
AELARKVQARLPTDQRVSLAFYSDRPGLADTITRVIEEGAQRIIFAHVRVTDPPEAVAAGELLEGIDLYSNRISAAHLTPLWDSDLLPQIYVRRVLEAVAMRGGPTADQIGLLLVGRGHGTKTVQSRLRREQEQAFLGRVKQALVRAGFDESQIATGWLRQEPIAAQALQQLVNSECKDIYWMPVSYAADGINTLYDIKAPLESIAAAKKLKLTGLGAWNADDLAAEEIATRVRAGMTTKSRPL